MKYFYWYRSIISRWAPCLDSRFPSKGPDHPMPKLAFQPIELKGDDENLTLDECIKRWPAPPEEPEMVRADPPAPPPPSDKGEAIASIPLTELEPKKENHDTSN